MIKVCIFDKRNDVSRFDIFKKFFECCIAWLKWYVAVLAIQTYMVNYSKDVACEASVF